jgi:GT2 family glycosyltransferase
VPHPGWLEAGVAVLDGPNGITPGIPRHIPSPTLWFADGSLEAAGSMGFGCLMPMGEDYAACRTAGILLMTRTQWAAVGEFLPIHYYSDDDWCWRWAKLGGSMRVSHRFAFTHGHHPRGRAEVQARAMRDRAAWLQAAAGHPEEETT